MWPSLFPLIQLTGDQVFSEVTLSCYHVISYVQFHIRMMLKTDIVLCNCHCINISAYILSNTLRNILSCSLFHFNTCFFYYIYNVHIFWLRMAEFCSWSFVYNIRMRCQCTHQLTRQFLLLHFVISPVSDAMLMLQRFMHPLCYSHLYSYTTIRCFLGLYSVDWM